MDQQERNRRISEGLRLAWKRRKTLQGSGNRKPVGRSPATGIIPTTKGS